MGMVPNQNGNYTVKKGDAILCEGEAVSSVNILLQGKADVYVNITQDGGDGSRNAGPEESVRSYKLFSLGQNVFFGTNDLFTGGKYTFSYHAAEDSNLYAFMVANNDQFKALLNSQKDYAAHMTASMSVFINSSYIVLSRLEKFAKQICTITENLVLLFWFFKESHGFSRTPSERYFRNGLDRLEILKDKGIGLPSAFDPAFIEKDHSKDLGDEYASPPEISAGINLQKVDYFRRLYNIPADIRKSFFGADITVTGYVLGDAAGFIEDIRSDIVNALKIADDCFTRLYSEEGECIFSEYVHAAAEMKKAGADVSDILSAIDCMVKKIGELAGVFEKDYCCSYKVDNGYVANMCNMARTAAADGRKQAAAWDGAEVSENTETIPDELKDSAKKLLEYSDIPKDRAELFWKNLLAFRNLRDKLSSDNDVRTVRNAVASVFFEIYGAVLKKSLKEGNNDRLIRMFLDFAYMDEKLLSPANVLALYKLSCKSDATELCPIYSMRDWLTMIYSGEKDPSIDEFGLDYYDVFREMKKRKEAQEKDKAAYDADMDGRLRHEAQNLFRINHRLCHGQVSVYFPILHDEMITKDLAKAYLSSDIVNEAVRTVMDVDYSIFHREVSYRNPERGIEKEFIMKSVPPEIILMPIFGSRAIMWQEITGRNRSAPGRFILPAFTSESIDDMILKLLGNFRWELCRTMMGVAWQDVTQKSLTSEYSDYIQFYKKNRDLSDEAKEKLKVQEQKYRGKLRDIFTADYELWISYESKGIIRLNKVARGILYRNCPLPKAIRENLEKQPMFGEIAAQFKIQRQKAIRELDNRYARLMKSGIEPDPELLENLRFYKEM